MSVTQRWSGALSARAEEQGYGETELEEADYANAAEAARFDA